MSIPICTQIFYIESTIKILQFEMNQCRNSSLGEPHSDGGSSVEHNPWTEDAVEDVNLRVKNECPGAIVIAHALVEEEGLGGGGEADDRGVDSYIGRDEVSLPGLQSVSGIQGCHVKEGLN